MKKPFIPWVWSPLLLGFAALGTLIAISAFPAGNTAGRILSWIALAFSGASVTYFLVQTIARLIGRRWKAALFSFVRFAGLSLLLIPAIALMTLFSVFGPSEDHFADNLTIPEGIEIAVPVPDSSGQHHNTQIEGTDDMQIAVKRALESPGGTDPSFLPSLPSLREASTDHPAEFREYIESSPDWHVFLENGNRFAARCWSYGGEPRDTLHGYISEFGENEGFQTRLLLCLDRKAWSSYTVQHVEEGTKTVVPNITSGNQMDESRVMIECGRVWLEVFEQSHTRERRVTKATLAILEKEFSDLLRDSGASIARAKQRSRDLAIRMAGTTGEPFRLLEGMQPGIYGVAYALNPGESGVVYLKAFEITEGTQLSEDRLKASSETRMAWSADPSERFGAKAGFTIYEGDWGKPYAARFEVWFKPDSGKPERKLAGRNFKIEGWQR